MALSAQNAIRDTLGAWLEGLSFTPINGGAAYQLAAVRARGPQSGDVVQYPSAAILVDGGYTDQAPVEVRGTRAPDEGDGTYLEKTGEFGGEATIALYANDPEQEDELLAGIEHALVPAGSQVPRLVLTAIGYHNRKVTVRRREVRPVRFQETAQHAVWRTVIVCGVAIDVVRIVPAADLVPQLDLSIDGGDEIAIDPVEGTTEIP
ncbi:MAG: hypothetical protein Q8R92_21070 [Deltaproteobacteria bacterium]|nr:hypothetical protein [Deltaproteobacteria bacterium]